MTILKQIIGLGVTFIIFLPLAVIIATCGWFCEKAKDFFDRFVDIIFEWMDGK